MIFDLVLSRCPLSPVFGISPDLAVIELPHSNLVQFSYDRLGEGTLKGYCYFNGIGEVQVPISTLFCKFIIF